MEEYEEEEGNQLQRREEKMRVSRFEEDKGGVNLSFPMPFC
jgi:hypothetical protein